MAEVGKSIGKKTQAGREVYETPDGEMVSEKSTTFKYKGKWINIPTIHNGYAYDDDMLRMMLDAEVIEPTSTHKSKEDAINSAIERSKSLKFNEGGLSSQTEEALGWAAEGKKLAVDTPEVSLRDAATFVAEMTPIVGDALAAKEVYDELQKDEPNYYLAGALGGAAIVGLVPGLGDVAAKAIKKGAKEVFDVAKRVEVDPNAMGSLGGNIRLSPKTTGKSKPSYTDAELLKADDVIDEWGKGNLTNLELRNQMRGIGFPIETKRISPKKTGDDLEVVGPDGNIIPWKDMPRGVDRKPDIKLSAVDPLEIGVNEALQDGKFLKKYDAATSADMVEKAKNATAGNARANALIDATVPKGTKVGIRLNLNSNIPGMPKGLDKLQTLHKGSFSGKALSYSSFATVKNVVFNVSQTGRTGIASKIKGIDTPEAKNKFNAMSVDGEYVPNKNLLDSNEDLVEIGFNPGVHHLFIDLKTGQAVKGAAEATVIGDRVFAKGVKYWKKAEAPEPVPTQTGVDIPSDVRYKFNQGGKVMNNQMEMAFMKQGGIKDDGMKRDPVSGNEIPPGSMAKEVRDDIPAMLSEGEYVVPADVLRFYGVNFFEDLRNQAKSGLQGMEQNGRIGGEPLSPQQVQQNMGQAPVQANQGGMMQGFNQAGLAGTPTPTSTFDPSAFAVVGGSTFNNQGQQAQQDSITTFKTFINSADGSTQVIEFVDGKLKNPAMEKFTQPPYYEQGSSALKKAQSQASSKDDKPDFPEPGEREDPKDWGLGVDWSDPEAYANTVIKGQMGRGTRSILQGLSAIAGPFATAAVGAGLGIQALSQVSNLRAAAEIARAQGMDEKAKSIDGMIKSFMAEQPAIVSFLDDLRGDSNTKAMGVMDRLGLKYTDLETGRITYSPEQLKHNLGIQERKKSFAKKTSDETAAIQAGGGASGDDDGVFVFAGQGVEARDGSGVGDKYVFDEDTTDYDATDDDVFDQIDADFAAAGVSQNKGGLMAPKKKKKK